MIITRGLFKIWRQRFKAKYWENPYDANTKWNKAEIISNRHKYRNHYRHFKEHTVMIKESTHEDITKFVLPQLVDMGNKYH